MNMELEMEVITVTNVIKADDLSKVYRRVKRKEGIWGSIQGLWKRSYEEKTAVNKVSLQIGKGELVGLIGPNGAGKTTLIKMLTGIIAPTSGSINVLGYYPNDLKNGFKQRYAVVMGQKSQLFFELTTNDMLRLFKEIYGMSDSDYERNRAYFTELFQVKDLLDVQVRTLSLGERMKMELMTALLHNPEILFLDEPTIGLDAIASKQIRGFLKDINKDRGTTIILTSHYMEDIKAICQRSVVINHGSIVYDGQTQELFTRYQRNKKISLAFEQPTVFKERMEPGVMLEETPYRKVISVPKENANELLYRLMTYMPKDIMIEEDDIGTVVERIYKDGDAAYE